MNGSVGIIGSRDKATIGDKMFIGVKSFNAVDFKIDGECRYFPDTGNAQEPLNVVVGNKCRMKR